MLNTIKKQLNGIIILKQTTHYQLITTKKAIANTLRL